MIDVLQACEMILKRYNNKAYITNIKDIGYGYVVGMCGLNGEEYDVPPEIVEKETGKISVLFPPHHRDELKKGKIIEVPEKYRMP